MPKDKHSYTQVESPDDYEGAEEIWSCNDCGAHAGTKEGIVHHKSCQPGESARWKEFYSQQPEDEDCPY
jgi:hypothetical protein